MMCRFFALASLFSALFPSTIHAGQRRLPTTETSTRDIAAIPERDLSIRGDATSDTIPKEVDGPLGLDAQVPIGDVSGFPQWLRQDARDAPQAPAASAVRPSRWARTRGFVRDVARSIRAAGKALPSAGSQSWNTLFDGVQGAWRLYGFGPDVKTASQIPDRLRAIASPWRTEVQLKRLAEKRRGKSEPFSYIWMSDLERGRYPWSRVFSREPDMADKLLQEIRKQKVDFIVLGGDLVSRGTIANYFQFFKRLNAAKLQVPVFFVMGNHDDGNPHGGGKSLLFHELIGEPNFAFDHGGIRFAVADTSSFQIRPADLRQLRANLDVPQRKHVFTHMPPSVMRNWTVMFKPLRGAGGFKQGAKRFADLMSQSKVEVVFQGHIHAFARRLFHGVLYVLSGGGGSPLYPSKIRDRFYHFIRVDVSHQEHHQTVFRWNEKQQRAFATQTIFVRAKLPASTPR